MSLDYNRTQSETGKDRISTKLISSYNTPKLSYKPIPILQNETHFHLFLIDNRWWLYIAHNYPTNQAVGCLCVENNYHLQVLSFCQFI